MIMEQDEREWLMDIRELLIAILAELREPKEDSSPFKDIQKPLNKSISNSIPSKGGEGS